ncbi:Uncharacterised protein [uncultured archaeon]|nr:Uncharacterised protein [uncultured archaeon]
MRKKIIGLFIIVLIITTVLPASGTSEERQKENSNINVLPCFIVNFGFTITDAVIASVNKQYDSYYYILLPVKNVTFIGYGYYYPGGITHFYIKTFRNVSIIYGFTTLRRFNVSEEYQHFTMLITPFFNSYIMYFKYQESNWWSKAGHNSVLKPC